MKNILIWGWLWIYNHLIHDPEIVAALYEDAVDDINNALQCYGCGAVFMAENIMCPGCYESDTVEMVFAPGQEATDFRRKPENDAEYEFTLDVSCDCESGS
jgi:hypothetical protein